MLRFLQRPVSIGHLLLNFLHPVLGTMIKRYTFHVRTNDCTGEEKHILFIYHIFPSLQNHYIWFLKQLDAY